MADARMEIKFNTSMTADKRNTDFAYLRKNILNNESKGLYPSKDFVLAEPLSLPNTTQILHILGNQTLPLKIITKTEAGKYGFYKVGSSSTSNTDFTGRILAAAYGTSSEGMVYFVDETSKKTYSVNYQNSNLSETGTFASKPIVNLGGYDGHDFWWAGNQIWRQLPGNNPVLVFDQTGFTGLRFMQFYDDYIVFFTQKKEDIYIYFWDKTNTVTFQKQIIIKGSVLLGAGIVDNQLMLIRSVAEKTNYKEKAGKMIISTWNGTSFKELNSITTGRTTLSPTSGDTGGNCASINEYMIMSVYGNLSSSNTDLYKNYVYKIYSNGRIEVLAETPSSIASNSFDIVAIGEGFNVLGVDAVGTDNIKIYTDKDLSNSFSDYAHFNSSEYITPFLTNPYNYHTLTGFSVTFEKMFKNTDNATTPPYVYPATITVQDLLHDTLTLEWVKANDGNTNQDMLEYSVYKSLTNNIDSIEDALANGEVIKDWTKDINTLSVIGLTPETQYYFQVLVRDTAWNMQKYETVAVTTYETSLMTPWLNPGSNGIVKHAGGDFGVYTNPTNAYLEDGVFASADNSPEKYHCFYNFNASVPGGATIKGIQIRLKGKCNYDDASFYISLTKEAGTDGGKTLFPGLSLNTMYARTSLINKEYIGGNQESLWGGTFTDAEVNANSLGLIVRHSTSGDSPSYTYYIDNLQIRIFYTI